MIWVQTNEAGRNRLMAMARGGDGSLGAVMPVETGGAGTGMPHLGSQGSVTPAGDRLLVANAGSGDVSVLDVAGPEPKVVAVVPSGELPVSVAEHAGLVYVLNAGDPSLTGFRLTPAGLEPLPDPMRKLPADADPAQVGFALRGSLLVVTQRGTDSIASYPVGPDGALGEPHLQPSSGLTPYGFTISAAGVLVVTEAFGAQAGRAAASSYRLDPAGLTAVSRSVGNGRTAICWAVSTADGRFAFATNFGDGAVSAYAIAPDGTLTLLDATAGVTVPGRRGLRDLALSSDGRYLYAIDADHGQVYGWAVAQDSTLSPLGSWGDLPDTAAGLAAS